MSDPVLPVATSRNWQPIELQRPVEVEEVPTPALLLDADLLDQNLERMASFMSSKGVGLRPHAKTHKSPLIAARQLELGAVGICCAKVGEAESMAQAGIDRILVTSPVATRGAATRLVALAAGGSQIEIVVDHRHSVDLLSDAAAAAGVELGVLIDLDVGTARTGVAPEKGLPLLAEIKRRPALRFRGLQAYAGHLMHVEGHAERAERSRSALQAAIDLKRRIEEAGDPVPVLTGGGTGTYDIDSAISEMTDLQVGSYIFMDAQYRRIGGPDSEVFDAFAPSLFVLATAISQPVSGLVTLDAGFKAMAVEDVRPEVLGMPGTIYHFAGDEHGILQLGEAAGPELGDQIRLLVSHCDPTVNLYDHYHVLRGGRVVELWPIHARGRSS